MTKRTNERCWMPDEIWPHRERFHSMASWRIWIILFFLTNRTAHLGNTIAGSFFLQYLFFINIIMRLFAPIYPILLTTAKYTSMKRIKGTIIENWQRTTSTRRDRQCPHCGCHRRRMCSIRERLLHSGTDRYSESERAFYQISKLG